MVVYYEMAEAGANRRRHRRSKSVVSGRYTSNGRVNDCVILDLSLGGAMLKAPRSATAGGPMVLTILRAGALRCEPAWRSEGRLAVRFLDDADAVAARIGRLLPACGFAPPDDHADAIPEGKEALEVAAAAARLRLPAGTVQLALERGIIDGFRDVRGRGYVLLDVPPDPPVTESAEAEIAEPGKTEPAPAPPEAPGGEPAAAPTAADLADLARHLRDEVRGLREEILRREAGAGGRDETIVKLIERFADMSQAIVERMPSADTIYAQIEQAMRAQRETTARHEYDLRAIKKVLGSMRDFLGRVQPSGRS